MRKNSATHWCCSPVLKLPLAFGWLALLTAAALAHGASDSAKPFRPPALPLVACDPYFSIWSPADKLTDANTVHWTGKPHRLTSLARIDGKAFRLMGQEPADVPALPQTAVEVMPARTVYTFESEGIHLTLTFMTAALPEDLDVLSRPVTYVTYEAKATDAKEHNAAFYLDASGEIAVNNGDQIVGHSASQVGNLTMEKLGSAEQPV